ncbi:hypothetical protein D0Y65_009892 [Glycine soja]|uniref:ATP-dependent DNA helicase n=1 Tax=Glycine soja TaxID=3848 RepID=A0A445L0Y6_GLYSO|nr:hypothetical protein D0Y65_009892 [Glycine soja]
MEDAPVSPRVALPPKAKLLNEDCHDVILSTEHADPRLYPPQVMLLIGKHLLFLIDRESAEGRCVQDAVNYPNGYMVHQICHDKQVLRMSHAKEFLTVAQEANKAWLLTLTSPQRVKVKRILHTSFGLLNNEILDCSFGAQHANDSLHHTNESSSHKNAEDAETDDVVPDYENELLDCVDDTAKDISIGFTDIIGLVKINHNVIFVNLNNIYFVGYVDLGDPSQICPYCQAAMCYQEKTRKNRKQANPKYSLCCSMGKIQLPFLKNPPMLLQQLLCDDESRKSRNYQQYIRAYKNLNLQLIADGKKDERIYNLPTVLEVAAVIVGDASQPINRDIILEKQRGRLQRINELHPGYLGLQYPLLFPYGEDGYRSDIKHRDMNDSHERKRNRLTIREFLCFRLQSTKNEAQTLLRSRRLFQQFILMISGFVVNIHLQLYWLEIQRSISALNLFTQDRPDIVTKVFKLKLEQLMSDLKDIKVLGNVLAYIDTIEFQKRGLPHARILLFLDAGSKYPSPVDIDRIISAEIPYSIEQPQLYECVKKHMMHGPCGHTNKQSPCMKDGKCSRYFPKNGKLKLLLTKTAVMFIKGIMMIKHYLDCRYISPCEACWRIFSFQIHKRSPIVERLYFHLPGENSVIFEDGDDIDALLSKPTIKESMFTSWLQANAIFQQAKDLTYLQFITKFTYIANKRCWKPRKRGYTIGRLNWVPPSTGEFYYLRMMLVVVKGPTTYEQIRTVNGQLYSTFREACFAMGFLVDDEEYIEALREAYHWGSSQFLRRFFVTMLLSNNIERPNHVWSKTWECLINGILHQQRRIRDIPDLQLETKELHNLALLEIKDILQSNKKSLKDYPTMPFPRHVVLSHRHIFDSIINVVNRGAGGMFFLYGYRGTGKTFMWKTLAFALCSKSDIVLTIASSGIALLLLPNGKIAHSKFSIPVSTLQNSTCNIHQGIKQAELLKETKLIIWDEAPMAHRYCFEALDKTLNDIMCMCNYDNVPFGGKIVVFRGDFRQILLVIPRGSRSDIVHATINASYLWDYCTVLKLTKNMCLQLNLALTNAQEIKNFLMQSYLPRALDRRL